MSPKTIYYVPSSGEIPLLTPDEMRVFDTAYAARSAAGHATTPKPSYMLTIDPDHPPAEPHRQVKFHRLRLISRLKADLDPYLTDRDRSVIDNNYARFVRATATNNPENQARTDAQAFTMEP